MEFITSESPQLTDLQTMDESLEFIFTTMIRQGEMLDAVEFIRSIEVNFLPSKTIMKTLIFDILMKNDNIRTLAFTADYLSTVIAVFPPINEERRMFYFDSIRDNHGFLADLWTVFEHIVKSYYIQSDIYVFNKEGSITDPIKYPNCKFLLNFYIKLFTEDFKHYKSDSSSKCLLMKMFWPNFDVRFIGMSAQPEILLKWINDIYSSDFINEVDDLLQSMHEILTLVVRCIIEGRHNLSHYAAFSSIPLAEIVDSIMHNCKSAFLSLSNVKKFLCFLHLKYLRAKVCEKLIKQIIKVSKKCSVLTLKDIVDQCMLPSKLSKLKIKTVPPVNKEKLRKKPIDKKYFADMKMETTKLHEFCKKNKFADLLEELRFSSEDINARDPAGNTPLHEACLVGNRLCVRHLIDEGCDEGFPGITQSLDFAAFNLEGITPLHFAVMNNNVDIAKMLLSHGGAELLTLSDNKGQVPADLSISDSMDKLLQEYDVKLKELASKDPTESDSSTDSRSKESLGRAPVLKNFKEYSIYLDALNCLLCMYRDIFGLSDYVWQKYTVVSSHSDKCCCHFIDRDVCSEDAAIISEMPNFIETFMESVKKNASKSDLNIDIELIPLQGFSASLKTG